MKLTDVTTGRRARPQKIMIYGVEGIGKSTLASQFPNPIFLDVEDRTAHLDIHRLIPKDWNELQRAFQTLYDEAHNYQTVVLDTADWAEMLAAKDLCERNNMAGIEAFGYGKGYQYVREMMQGMLWGMHNLQYKHGMHVVVVAHARIKKFDDPQQAVAYDRFTLKCSESVSAMLREWVDAVLFANYNTLVETGQDKIVRAKAGNRRMLYTNHTAAYDAKNSYGLPDELPMDYEHLRPYIEASYAGKITYNPAPQSQEELIAKKRYQETAISLAGPLGGLDYVKALAKELNVTFKTMTIPECEDFVETVRSRVTAEMNRREGETNHA